MAISEIANDAITMLKLHNYLNFEHYNMIMVRH